MSGSAGRRCAVCGDASPSIESNHIAARANDRTLILPMCTPCHNVITDWQWALGILRRETLEARAQHSELERAWALIEGLALTAMMAAPTEHQPSWVLLGRAAGTFYKIREEQQGADARWGPKPALTRSRRSLPPRRGQGDSTVVLGAILASGDKLAADDPDWRELRDHAVTMADTAAQQADTPASWYTAITLLEVTLGDLAELSGPEDLQRSKAARERTLQAVADLFVGGGAPTSPAAPRKVEQGPGPQPDG